MLDAAHQAEIKEMISLWSPLRYEKLIFDLAEMNPHLFNVLVGDRDEARRKRPYDSGDIGVDRTRPVDWDHRDVDDYRVKRVRIQIPDPRWPFSGSDRAERVYDRGKGKEKENDGEGEGKSNKQKDGVREKRQNQGHAEIGEGAMEEIDDESTESDVGLNYSIIANYGRPSDRVGRCVPPDTASIKSNCIAWVECQQEKVIKSAATEAERATRSEFSRHHPQLKMRDFEIYPMISESTHKPDCNETAIFPSRTIITRSNQGILCYTKVLGSEESPVEIPDPTS